MGVLGLAAQSAAADTASLAHASKSTNWAGYAVHRLGVSFNKVQGTWREPRPSCTRGRQTFSSYWVGIGGYSLHSRALEQAGTEVDCTSAGTVRTFAWYEVVPAPSIRIGLPVPPGDTIRGAVTVHGRRVHFLLRDLTRHRSFSRFLSAPAVDSSSAEWIVEAPSDCLSTNTCITLPLGDFGSTTFTNARTRSGGGHVGTISDRHWGAAEINLIPRGRISMIDHQRLGAGGEAKTSALRAGGSAFTVSYVSPRGQATSLAASDQTASPAELSVPARRVEHPRRRAARSAG